MEEENERLSLELEKERRPSTGRSNTEAQLTQKKRELASAQREVRALREAKEGAEEKVGEVRGELEREKERVAELEAK